MPEEPLDVISGTVSLPYQWTTGPAGARFLAGLREGKVLGTRCPQCRRVLVPARSFCPRCFVDTSEWVQVSERGRLRTYTIINYRFEGQPKKPPYIIGIIDLEGADVGFVHFIGEVDLSDFGKVEEVLKPGTLLQAVWAKERQGRITDIEHFVPVIQ